MSISAWISIFWKMSLLLQCGLVAVLIGKKSLRRFPFFASYASFTLFSSGVIYLLQGVSKSPFLFYLSWSFEGIGVILGFAVVYEVFEWLLRPYPALRRIALLVFQWSVIALVLMACVVLYAQSTSDQDRRFFSAVMVLEEATRVIEVGLLMFLFLFSTAFGLHWRQCVFGMALGLGIFTTAELVGITMRNFWVLEGSRNCVPCLLRIAVPEIPASNSHPFSLNSSTQFLEIGFNERWFLSRGPVCTSRTTA